MKVPVLGAWVDALDMEGALDRIDAFIQMGTPHQVITLNAEMLYRAQKDPGLLALINGAHLVTSDGAGIVWAAGRLGHALPGRVTGIDLSEAVARRAAERNWRLFLFGAAPGVAVEAGRRLQARYPGLQIAGTEHGFSAPGQELHDRIKASRPHVLLVALGAPRQEIWIKEHLHQLEVPVCIGVGGSFDVLAGRVRRAPAFFRRFRLEWLCRLLREPRRARRMLALPVFMLLVARASLSSGRK